MWERSWFAARAASSAPAAIAGRSRRRGDDPADPEVYAGLGAVYRSFARVGELEAPTWRPCAAARWAPVST